MAQLRAALCLLALVGCARGGPPGQGAPVDGDTPAEPDASLSPEDGTDDSSEARAIQVAPGTYHACALTAARAVKCWGMNDYGQLGDGTTTDSLVPVAVTGLPTGVVQIATGQVHSCALTAQGAVYCWGANNEGALGNGTRTSSPVPVQVQGLGSGTKAISARGSAFHTCALSTTGGVQCWGHNTSGQLGNNSTAEYSLVPVPVFGLSSGVAAISSEFSNTCGLTTSGGVQCWGYNNVGQLGASSQAALSRVPVPVVGLSSGAAAISTAWLHSCALMTSGAVTCWGQNELGSLGNGSTMDSRVPVPVTGLGGVTAIAAGAGYTFARTSTGSFERWGHDLRPTYGSSPPSFSTVPTPVALGLPDDVLELAAGNGFACSVSASGAIHCWGYNDEGQLGNNSKISSVTPVPVVGFP